MGPAADPLPGPRLALVVATNTYTDPGLRQLRAPARDADDLTQVLADPRIGGFNVTTVIDQPAQQIRLDIENFLDGRGTGDLLLVYLSCHGLLDARRRLYFAATDTLKDRLGATGVEAAWVLDQLEHCRARRQVLILDSCFSGAFARGAKGEADVGLQHRFLGEGRGRVVLTASNATEYSFEGAPTDADSPAAASVFTSALVHGLRTGEADTDHDGRISVDDAYAYVFDRVRVAGAAQTPQRWLYGAEGEILLARNPAGPTIIPAQLPESLRAGLDSPHPSIRIGAVTELGEWLTGSDPARAAAARQHLQAVAETDIPRVAQTARTLLEVGTRPPADEAPHPGTSEPARPPADEAPHPGTSEPARPPADEAPHPGTGEPARPPADEAPHPGTNEPAGRRKYPRTALALGAAIIAAAGITSFVLLNSPAKSQAPLTSPSASKSASTANSRSPVTSLQFTPAGIRLPSGYSGNNISSLAFNPSGATLAVAGNPGICLWDIAAEHCSTAANLMKAWSVAFSPDGRLLAAVDANSPGANDKIIRLWNVATSQPTPTLLPNTKSQGAFSVACSPDNKTLAAGDVNGSTYLWNVVTHTLIAALPDPRGRGVNSVAFSRPDGTRLGAGDVNGSTYLWNVATHTLIATLPDPQGQGVNSVAFSPDGTHLAAADANGSTYLWNVITHTLITALPDPEGKGAYSVAFSPDGRLLASGDNNDSIYVWNVATGKRITILREPSPAPNETGVNSVVFSPRGRILAAGYEDGSVYLWSISLCLSIVRINGPPSCTTPQVSHP